MTHGLVRACVLALVGGGAVLAVACAQTQPTIGPSSATCVHETVDGLRPYVPIGRGSAVLVVLSPRMPYALQRWPAMEAKARGLGFTAHALRDPRVALAEWRAAVDAMALPALRCIPALELALARQLGVLHHAPSSLVAHCGHLHPWPILGVMPDDAWAQLLQHRRAQLEEQACHSR